MPKLRLQASKFDARTAIVLEMFDSKQRADRLIENAPQCPSCYAHRTRKCDDGSFECPGCRTHVIRVRAPFVRFDGRPVQPFADRHGDTFKAAGHA